VSIEFRLCEIRQRQAVETLNLGDIEQKGIIKNKALCLLT
jgi:hypothetical protein